MKNETPRSDRVQEHVRVADGSDLFEDATPAERTMTFGTRLGKGNGSDDRQSKKE